MIVFPWKQKKILTSRKMTQLAERLSRCPDVTRFNEGRWREEWVLAYCFDGIEDSARDFLNDHLPGIMRLNIEEEELTNLLVVEILEDFRHTLYHIRKPRFYGYLQKEDSARLSKAGRNQTARPREEHASLAGLFKEARSREDLTARLARLPQVKQYDTDDWKEAEAIVDCFAGVAASFRDLLDDQFPKLTKHRLRPEEACHLLLQIGANFLRILKHIKASQFYWYLLEPLDQEWIERPGS
mgnify:CR=1 FL=1|jgi:hypothetical protein